MCLCNVFVFSFFPTGCPGWDLGLNVSVPDSFPVYFFSHLLYRTLYVTRFSSEFL